MLFITAFSNFLLYFNFFFIVFYNVFFSNNNLLALIEKSFTNMQCSGYDPRNYIVLFCFFLLKENLGIEANGVLPKVVYGTPLAHQNLKADTFVTKRIKVLISTGPLGRLCALWLYLREVIETSTCKQYM